MRRTRRVPKILSEEDLQKIVFTIDNSPRYSKNQSGEYMKWRDATMFMTMYYCILRPMECSHLRWSDIDFEKREININPINNKERNNLPAMIPEKALHVLTEYKEKLKEFGISNEWVFPSLLTWLPMTTDHLGKRFTRVVREAGILKFEYFDEYGRPKYNYNMYSLRHSACTKVYRETHSEKAVSLLARHLTDGVAHRYIHLDTKTKKEMVDDVFK